jgi:hypothetical protein
MSHGAVGFGSGLSHGNVRAVRFPSVASFGLVLAWLVTSFSPRIDPHRIVTSRLVALFGQVWSWLVAWLRPVAHRRVMSHCWVQ